MKMIKAIQVVADFKSKTDAELAYGFLMSQDDCFAGRVYHCLKSNKWTVQTINAPGDDWKIGGELPESMRYVLCPTSHLLQMEAAS